MKLSKINEEHDPFTVSSEEEVASAEEGDEFDQAELKDLLKTWARDEGKTIVQRAKKKNLFDHGVRKMEKGRIENQKIRLKSLKQAFERTKTDLTELGMEQKEIKKKVKKVEHISSLNPEKWTTAMRRFIADQEGKFLT